MDILPNKFGEFLVLLAGGIMMTACKKEEKAMPKNQNQLQLVSNYYELNGFVGKLYMDSKGTPILFSEVSPKAVQYTGIFNHVQKFDKMGRCIEDYYTCNEDPTKNCAWVNRNGNLTLVVKPGVNY